MIKAKREQLDFIMNQKKLGKSYAEIVLAFGKKFGIRKSSSSIQASFLRYKDQYDLKGLKSSVEVKSEIVKSRLLESILEMIEKRKYVPIQAEFLQYAQIGHEVIRNHFTTFENLILLAKEHDPEVFENIIDEDSFNEENFKELRNYISKHDRFIITTAVTNCAPHEGALKAVETWQKANKGGFLILPCSDPARQSDKKNKWTLSHKLPKDRVVFKDLSLNTNLMLSTIKMSAKQLQPLTGLRRIGQRNGSTIFASPKQFLEFTANSNSKVEIPRALMTTGSITKADYRRKTEMYMSDRTAYLADQDHVLGAIIVEIKNGKTFFFRQVQFEPSSGAFCDLDKKYYPDGRVEKITAELVQLGDYHVLSTDPAAKRMGKEICEMVKPDILTVEDFCDGITINPHEKNNIVSRSSRSKKGLLCLESELRANSKEIDDLCTWPVKKLVFKYGNHEDFLKRWLTDSDFVKDPINKLLGMKLTLALEELGIMPLEYAMRELYKIKNQDKVQFLSVNDSFKVNGIENGAHGHLGKSGHRNPNMAELEDCYGACNVGHNHSAAIWRSAFRVGTSTHLQLSYNDGPSGWTQTHLIQHRNGSRQLVHCIYGEWRLK